MWWRKKDKVEKWIAKLKRKESDIQKAVRILGKSGDTRAVKPLIQAIGDKRPYLRTEIAKALGEIGDTPAIWYNPEVSELTASMSKLKKIEIHAETYDFHLVERFITYAVNYIGQKHLREQVEVHIHGDPDKLHSNLRNSLENLCKCVEVHEEDS